MRPCGSERRTGRRRCPPANPASPVHRRSHCPSSEEASSQLATRVSGRSQAATQQALRRPAAVPARPTRCANRDSNTPDEVVLPAVTVRDGSGSPAPPASPPGVNAERLPPAFRVAPVLETLRPSRLCHRDHLRRPGPIWNIPPGARYQAEYAKPQVVRLCPLPGMDRKRTLRIDQGHHAFRTLNCNRQEFLSGTSA